MNEPKAYSMADLAARVGGRLSGDGAAMAARLAHPSQADGEGDLALAMDPKLLPLLAEKGIKLAVLAEGVDRPSCLRAAIFVSRPRLAMSGLTSLFEKKVILPERIHPTAIIEPGAELADDAVVGAFAYICTGAMIGRGCVLHPQTYVGPDAIIGEGSLIYPGVRIGARVKIGARAIIHFNASIGSDGFSFVTPEVGSVEAAKATGEIGAAQNMHLLRISSLGSVEIGDDVEIGANTAIDRGTIVSTRIGSGTKIDNLVQIGHNVVIGENCLLCGHSGVAGSSELGNRVVLGGGVGVADHVTIGDDVVVMGKSGVAGSVPPRTVVGGLPAKPRAKYLEDLKNIGRVKYLSEKVKNILERLDVLERSGHS